MMPFGWNRYFNKICYTV